MAATAPAPAPQGAPSYAEYPPSPPLAAWVECFWSITAVDAPATTSRVLPDGCADVIVDLATGDGAGAPFVVGAMRRATVVPISGRVDLFGVRFQPGGAFPFLDIALDELTDRTVALDALWGGVADALADALADVPASERVARVEALLLRGMRSRRWSAARREVELVASAVALVRRARGGVGVRETAAALGVGERRLERAFDRCVGLSPKFLARVLRFRAATVEIARRGSRWTGVGGAPPSLSWSALAHASGYADQPHFNREFRALAGLTPAQWAAERAGVGFVQDETAGE